MDIQIALKVALAAFMAGSLLEMGLRLPADEALRGLRAPRVLGLATLLGFLVSPLVALALSHVLALDAPYALGLTLVGLTPCAPFLPALARRAGGRDGTVPAMMLVTAVLTIALLPLALPLLSSELSVSPLRLARPLLVLIVLPLAVGMLVLAVAPATAARLRRPVHRCAVVAALLALALCAVVYGRGFVGAVGSFAIAAQFLFFIIIAALAFALSPGLAADTRAVLVLAMGTRNVGAALAPLFASSAIDDRAIVMVVLAVPVQIVVAFGAAAWLRRGTQPAGRTHPPSGEPDEPKGQDQEERRAPGTALQEGPQQGL